MSRNDKDDVSHLDLPDPIQTVANYYFVDGSLIDREEYYEETFDIKNPPKVCAKQVQHKDSGVNTYFVLCSNGQLFDPRNIDRRYRVQNVWKFRRVTRTCFDMYIKFLKNKYTSMLSQAQRSM